MEIFSSSFRKFFFTFFYVTPDFLGEGWKHGVDVGEPNVIPMINPGIKWKALEGWGRRGYCVSLM